MVLGVATVLGLIGPVAAFGLFYLGERIYHPDRPHVQTLMYLMLSCGGTSDDFPDPHPWPVVVDTPRPYLYGWPWSAPRSCGHLDCRLRALRDTAGLGLGALRLVWGYALVWFLL